MSYSLPILSIPAFYALALTPAAVAGSIVVNAKALDTTNPNGSGLLENLKKRLSSKEYARYERSKSCSRNHFENMPLYFATILAGLYAERETAQKLDLTTFAISFLVVRTLYTINYVIVSTKNWSYVRSLLYFISVGLCFNILLQAAKALAA